MLVVGDRRSAESPVTAVPADRSGRPYRVEHRRGDVVAVAGDTDDPLAHYTLLVSLAARLLDAGVEGSLPLIERETGDVVARRALHAAGGGHGTGDRVVG
jgi:hypothetical protein